MVGEGTGTYRLRDLRNRDFPGSPVVKNLPSTTEDMGLIPGQGTKIPTCHLVKPKINKLEKTTITKKPHQKTIIWQFTPPPKKGSSTHKMGAIGKIGLMLVI